MRMVYFGFIHCIYVKSFKSLSSCFSDLNDVNECEADPMLCKNGGTCNDQDYPVLYNCTCPAEWVGEHCETGE